MATHEDYLRETERLRIEQTREAEALAKCYDMHGGDNPGPNEKPMPTIITQFGTWAITPFGVECLTFAYQIQWDSILDPHIDDDYWLTNLSKKEWVNLHDFAEALRHGRRIHHYLQNILPSNNTA